MNGISIFRIEEKHLSDIADLERTCFAHPWTETGLQTLVSENGVGFCAVDEESGRVVSYGGMVMSAFDGDITDVATLPEFRRRGLSRAVMGELIEFARRRSLEVIALEVRASNSAAIALYLSLGFKNAGTRKNFYTSPCEDAYVMIKELK